MKMMLLPIIVIIVVLLLATFSLIFLYGSTNQLSKFVDTAARLSDEGNFEESKKQIDLFKSKYKKYEKIYSIVIRHAELDEIRILSERVSELNTPNTKEDFLAESSALTDMLLHLYKSERISLENIL